MEKAQFELFLVNVDPTFVKSETSLFGHSASNSLPEENLPSDVNEFSDYYGDDSDNLNVYLVNEEIVYTESTFGSVVDAPPSVESQQIDQFISSNDGDRMEEIFIDVEKGEHTVQFLTADALAELDLDDNDQTYICSTCKCPYSTEEALSLHQFSCSEIQKQTFATDVDSPKKDSVSLTVDLATNIKYSCSQCTLTFKSQSGLRKHTKIHHPVQQFTFSEINANEKDESFAVQKSHECKYCHLKFAREKALISHERIHETDKASPVEFICKNCDKKFTRQRLFEHHFVKCISSGGGGQKSKKRSSGKIEIESTVTSTSSSSSTAKSNIHPCPQCSKMFATKQKVFRHMWIHRKKAFSCEVCAASFGEQHELDEHRLSRHAEERPYVCTECGKSFSSRQGLWEHNRIHSTNPNLIFTCETCQKTFSSRQGYLIHIRTHTGEKPFQCSFCDKSFRDSGTLRKHQRIHTGERPHKCPLCAKGFNQKVVLREHVRWVHASNKNEYPDPQPYHCSLCSVGHSDREELCTHIVKHSDQIAAFNKENSKQMKNGSAIVATTMEETGHSTLDTIIPDGAKSIQKVVQKNRIILRKYKTLYSSSHHQGGYNNFSIVSGGGKVRPTNNEINADDDDDDDGYSCQMCGTAFRKHDCLFQHIKSHT